MRRSLAVVCVESGGGGVFMVVFFFGFVYSSYIVIYEVEKSESSFLTYIHLNEELKLFTFRNTILYYQRK
jgi:hypothetical protein